MNKPSTQEREQKEIDYWQKSATENPSNFTLDNLINKISEAEILLYKIRKYKDVFEKSNILLELGAGQGWASCILKSLFKNKIIYASDISEHAIKSLRYWEDTFKVQIDGNFFCKSYDIPLKNESVDLIYCFQSAHHFTQIRETIREMHRILKKGGVCLFLHEPSCRKYLYKFAYKRVNKKRKDVIEDVLLFKDIEKIGREEKFNAAVQFDPLLIKRGPIELLYYYALSKIKPLQHLLPCSADYIFKK